ncbi:NUDIX hydrolase domain-like protein [Phlebopus sp. FC_14]|nr:NUDIX hydrolase domain-like protein [Phlebopus sp. FC_14]
MGGSPLNRLSWLRPSQSFLNALITSPTTRWVLFKSGQPLVAAHLATDKRTLALLTTKDVTSLLGDAPYFGQGKEPGEEASATSDDVARVLESARLHGPRIVFLGLKESHPDVATALPSSEFKDPHAAVANLEGTPYFSLDVADLEDDEESKVDDIVQSSSQLADSKLAFTDPRAAMTSLDVFTAAVFAEARSMVDWNERNKFCPACGSPTYSLWAGWKISCSTLLPWADNTGKKPCPSGRGLQNFCHPRTDPVVIMVVMNEANDKILLGRNASSRPLKRFPPKLYSALAGFVEPGESYEDAVKREMWEEAGVKVWNVRYHSGQPWPFPANLMLGFYATADSDAPIRTDLDNELEDARWYTREQVLTAVNAAHDRKTMSPNGEPSSDTTVVEPPFRMPPLTAIAGVLIRHWVEDKVEFVNAVRGSANL